MPMQDASPNDDFKGSMTHFVDHYANTTFVNAFSKFKRKWSILMSNHFRICAQGHLCIKLLKARDPLRTSSFVPCLKITSQMLNSLLIQKLKRALFSIKQLP